MAGPGVADWAVHPRQETLLGSIGDAKNRYAHTNIYIYLSISLYLYIWAYQCVLYFTYEV